MIQEYPEFVVWKKYITALAGFPATYMKLSGLFSEMEPLPTYTSEEEETKLISSTAEMMGSWLQEIEDNFQAHRIMFGSDWPVCNVGGIGQPTWLRWLKVVNEFIDDLAFMDKDDLKAEVFGGVAGRVYGCRTSSEPYRCDRPRCPFSE